MDDRDFTPIENLQPFYCHIQIGEYAELGDVKAEDLDKDEAEFLRVCETRVKDCEGKLKVSRAEENMKLNMKENMKENI